MDWQNPLRRRRRPLAAADDRLLLWGIVQLWLLGWGLGLLVEPVFPGLFGRPFTAVALWPFALWPHWVTGLLFCLGGLAVAVSCAMRLPERGRLALRLVGVWLLCVLLGSYVLGGFPYAVIQFGTFLGVLVASYLLQPAEC